jgi:uncharacterized membrane protein
VKIFISLIKFYLPYRYSVYTIKDRCIINFTNTYRFAKVILVNKTKGDFMKLKVLVLSSVFGILAALSANSVFADDTNEVSAKGYGSFTSYSTSDIATPEIIGEATQTAFKNAVSQAKFLCGRIESVTPVPGELKTEISAVFHTPESNCRFPRFCDDTNERWTIMVTVAGSFTCEN